MIKLKVIPDGGDPYEMVCTSRDIARWEKTTKGASLAQLEENLHAVDVYKISWFAAQRLGHITSAYTLPEWETSVDFDVISGDDGEADPTPSAA